jgi:hypothetical protein
VVATTANVYIYDSTDSPSMTCDRVMTSSLYPPDSVARVITGVASADLTSDAIPDLLVSHSGGIDEFIQGTKSVGGDPGTLGGPSP